MICTAVSKRIFRIKQIGVTEKIRCFHMLHSKEKQNTGHFQDGGKTIHKASGEPVTVFHSPPRMQLRPGGINNAVSGIDFSSPFSDETQNMSIQTETHMGREDNLEVLKSVLDSDFKLPMIPKNELFRDSREAQAYDEDILSSPSKAPAKVLASSSPLKKKIKLDKIFKDQTRNYSRKADKSEMYPTIHLSTQRNFGVGVNEGDNNEKSNTPKEMVKNVKPIILSSEQEYILQLAMRGASLFYTGSAGTGKSVLLRSIIKALRQKYEKGKVAVTASTGLAACNIGGITLHSFAGVGLGDGPVDVLMKRLKRNKKAYNRWCQIKVLIIDEVSMIDGNFLNKLDHIAKATRKNKRPFGGIQLIVSGDFYQLPPVSKSRPRGDMADMEMEEAIFAFESEAWKNAIQCTIILREVFRQRGDHVFIEMLNDMRSGKVTSDTIAEFNKLTRPLETSDGIEAAELFSTRYEVENANNTKLRLLKGTAQLFKSIDSGSLQVEQRQAMLNNFLAPQKLFLKKNAQVMCIKNFDETLVNGSLGQVVNFMDKDTYMCYNLMKEKPYASVEEISQDFNKRLEKTKPDQEELDVEQGATQLSDSIFDFLNDDDVEDKENISSMDNSILNENIERKKAYLNSLHQSSNKIKYPLVRFLLPDGYNTREVLVEPEEWTVEDEHENVLVRRVQLPLILAWSLSIHKSQGQTLPKVKVDLKRVFERGQAYVALSRAVSRKGLQVLNFDRSKILAHPKVNEFYSTLTSAGEIAHRDHSRGFTRDIVANLAQNAKP